MLLWPQFLLVTAATSLADLITGASSVAIFDLPNIAIGNVLGACMLNLLIAQALAMGLQVPIRLFSR